MTHFHRWQNLWHRLNGQTEPKTAYDALVALYSEPQRAYHTLNHINDCLSQFEQVRHLATQGDVVEMALWLHDVIYDPRAADNEEQSARWAVEVMQAAQMATETIDAVSELILATKHTGLPQGNDAQLLVDIDLSILGRPPAHFDQYEAQIRVEYQWVPLAQYRSGRSHILQTFLNRETIYQTSFFQAQFETQARENLARSIGRLT